MCTTGIVTKGLLWIHMLYCKTNLITDEDLFASGVSTGDSIST